MSISKSTGVQLLLVLCLLAGSSRSAEPVMRVIPSASTGRSLLRNGGFEETSGTLSTAWRPHGRGFSLVESAHGGARALFCENPEEQGECGAIQTLALNRQHNAPLTIRGWSKAENVGGSPDAGYAIYIDILYDDGSPLWGQTAHFSCGTHDWQKKEFLIFPAKPIKTLTVYALFRGHSGKVWFDDFSVEEPATGDGPTLSFQGIPVLPNRKPPSTFSLSLPNPNLNPNPNPNPPPLPLSFPTAFLARDVAANSDIYAFADGRCPELGLRLQTEFSARSNHLVVEGKLLDTTHRDRAVTLVFALALNAQGWRWGDDIRHDRRIEGPGEFANVVGVRCGSTSTLSLYPLAAIYSEDTGLAIALDMAKPAQYRLFYHAGTGQLCLAYDFGLVPETDHFPNAAEFRFVVYPFAPRWGFRAAFQKLVEIFPAYFTCRTPEQGIWMPFTDISRVQGWEDFGFKFHEGNNNVPFDDAHGILSFRYTEPMTWWMPMSKGRPRRFAEALQARDELAQGAKPQPRQMAAVSQLAAMTDAEGQPQLLFRNEPWCDGAVWSLNPSPHLPGAFNAATVHWNETLKQQLYGPNAQGNLDGEYLDSLEGYVTADLNFRREHFHYTTVPLTFATDTHQPALFKGLAVFEFTKWFCDQVHGLDKLTFANGVPYRFTFLCPWLDVMGTETDWLRAGQYQPAPETQMNLWRTLSGPKPYLLLMNTTFDHFTPEWVEKYFQRSLFYGFFPSMFSHNASENPYWQNPKWYNRDRPLFKKYLPLIRRVAQAGWQPVTHATCDNPRVFVERFGPDSQNTLYFTLLNDSAQPQAGALKIDTDSLSLHGVSAQELISDRNLIATPAGLDLRLAAQSALLIQVHPHPVR